MDECGGCQGIGRHKRWCEAVVGRSAAFLGGLSERADSLGDTVGGNVPVAANHLWIAAKLLSTEANALAIQFQEQTGARPDGSKSGD